MLLAFIGHDVAQQPQRAIHPLLPPTPADSVNPERHGAA
jgi:hypothetical protein